MNTKHVYLHHEVTDNSMEYGSGVTPVWSIRFDDTLSQAVQIYTSIVMDVTKQTQRDVTLSMRRAFIIILVKIEAPLGKRKTTQFV